jgi:hypothetical protein
MRPEHVLGAPYSGQNWRNQSLLAIHLDLNASDWWGRFWGCASARSILALTTVVEAGPRDSVWESSMCDCVSNLASSATSFWNVSLSMAG